MEEELDAQIHSYLKTKKLKKAKKVLGIIVICFVTIAFLSSTCAMFFVLKKNRMFEENVNVNLVCTKTNGEVQNEIFNEFFVFNLNKSEGNVSTLLEGEITQNTIIEYTYSIDNKTKNGIRYVISLDCENIENFSIVYRSKNETELNSSISAIVAPKNKVDFKIIINIKNASIDANLVGNLIFKVQRVN